MSYDRLIRQRDAIEARAEALVALVDGPPRVAEAVDLLRRLAGLIRDHVANEDLILADTLRAAARDRHHAAAATAIRDVEDLREDWALYLYRWSPAAIARDWGRFALETRATMERVGGLAVRGTAILYSLALHYRLIAPRR